MNFLCLLPVIGAGFAFLAFVTSYIVAVARRDVYPWWPYISDTGTTVPESCIFGELLTLTAICASIGMLIRYKWVQTFNVENNKTLSKLNSVSLVIGGLSCFFMTMVANFQETNVRPVHMPVSAATFTLGLIYNILHTEITRRMSPKHSTQLVWILRLSIVLLGFASFTLLYGFGLSSDALGRKWYGNNSSKRLHWDPTDPGWNLHIVATIAEWCVGVTTIVFFLTFCYEFKKIKLTIASKKVNNSGENDDDAPLIF